MKRRFFTGALIIMCLSVLAQETLAYFTAQDKAHNVITSGEINIQLLEWADEDKTIPFPQDAVTNVMPGTEVTKIVEVKNTGANAAYIRVKVQKEIVLPQGATGQPNSGLMNIDYNKTHWTLGEDGYYYYKEALAPDAVTKPLFACINFDSAMGNIYQNSTAKVDVAADAVQVANNGDNALAAKGWPAGKETER